MYHFILSPELTLLWYSLSSLLITETKMSSFWWNFHCWLHWKLSKWQLPVQPAIKNFTNMSTFPFQCNTRNLAAPYTHWSLRNKLRWNVKNTKKKKKKKSTAGVYTKFSGRLSEEPFPRLIQKFPCTLIFKTGQPGCQLNLSEGQIRLDLTSGRPLV